jgi:biopolymer transport protein ExbD
MAAKLSGGGGRHAIRQNADINVTPFVDILMVLLVIFMVAVPTAVTSLKVDLPPPSFDKPTAKPVVITIQDSGALFLAGQATRLDALSGDLTARFKADGQAGPRSEQRVMISAQADLPYEAFMSVINELHHNGWTRVGIVNEDLH